MKYLNQSAVTAMLAVALGGFGIQAAQAEELPLRGPIPFAAYDLDGNGAISEAEFSAVREKRMAAKAAAGMPMRGAANQPSFAAFDANADGQLSPAELAAGQQKMQQMRRGMGRGAGQGPGMGRGMGMGTAQGRGMGPGGNMPAFADFDLNGDGRIPEDEFLKAQSKRISERSQAGYPMRNIGNMAVFGDIDTNRDGFISADEFSAHQIQHRQQMMRQ